ncbi:hypothetical protein MKEN_00565700 [Mycena kentingensis (nom. inval.)]|nr:hypothetical protein MKEN_00565700 [Mycena kentingensis (nom. inval.)]
MSPANFESLPNEMLLEIVSLLPRDANASLSLVNHRLCSLTRAEVFSQLTLTMDEDVLWQRFPPFGTSYPQQLQALIFTQLPRFQSLMVLTLSLLHLKLSDMAALLGVASLRSVTASHCEMDGDDFYNEDHDLPLQTWQLSTFAVETADESHADVDIWMMFLDPAHLRTLHLPTATANSFSGSTVFPNVTRLSVSSAMFLNVDVMKKLPNVEHLTITTSEEPYFDEAAYVSFRAQCPLRSLRTLVLVEFDDLNLPLIFIPHTPIAPHPHLTTLTLPCSFFDLHVYCERLQQLPALRFLWMKTSDDTIAEDDWTTVDAFEEIVSLEIPLPNNLLAFAVSIHVGIHELSETPIQPSMFWPAFKSRSPAMADLWLVGDDFLIHGSADEGCVSYASEPVHQLRAKGQPIAEGDLGMYFAKRCSSEAELEAAQKELDEWWDRL